MKFEHQKEVRDGHTLHHLINHSAGSRIAVDLQGAEMVSLARQASSGEWTGYLYRDNDISAPAEGWKSHATVMGYYIHRLVDEKSDYEGDLIRGGNHSFIRSKTFADPVVALADESATLVFRLEPDQIAHEEYPRRVALELRYRLESKSVELSFGFHNQETTRPAHVSFGLHPGFAVNDLSTATVRLPRGRYRRHLAPGNFLSGATEEFTADSERAPFPIAELPDSFLIEPLEVTDRSIQLTDPDTGRITVVNLGNAPYFTVWSDLHPFLCIEPCWGLPDHQKQRPFQQKLGIQTIPPGEKLTRSCSIEIGSVA